MTTTVEVVHEVYMTHLEASCLSVTIQRSETWITKNLWCAVTNGCGGGQRPCCSLTLSLARLPQQTAVSKILQRGQTWVSRGGWHPHTKTLIIFLFILQSLKYQTSTKSASSTPLKQTKHYVRSKTGVFKCRNWRISLLVGARDEESRDKKMQPTQLQDDLCRVSNQVWTVINTGMFLKISRTSRAKKSVEPELLITPSFLTLWPHLPGGRGRLEEEEEEEVEERNTKGGRGKHKIWWQRCK